MLTPDQHRRLLHHYPILAALDPALLRAALTSARVLTAPAGTRLFDVEQACPSFPFVLDGTVKVFRVSASGRELPLYRVSPGDACVVSSGCVLGRRPYLASGLAQDDCELVLLPAEDVERLLAERPFRDYVFGLLSERLVELMQLIDEVAFRRLDQRLAALLLGRGGVVRLSHQQLADELGSVREIVSRLLKGFAEQGLVTLGREQIAIVDAAGLRRLARAV